MLSKIGAGFLIAGAMAANSPKMIAPLLLIAIGALLLLADRKGDK